MLAVITDDLTGASEIAGIALFKGSTAVIASSNFEEPKCDVLVVSSNMRSLDPRSAATKSADLTRSIMALSPSLIYKKTDSVLRGNVGPELQAQMHVERKTRALLVPANPSRNRIIRDGIYYVDGRPVAESGFGCTGKPALRSSSVAEILALQGVPDIVNVSPGDPLTKAGIYIGNAEYNDDLRYWATCVDDAMVPAGAADFFAVLLDTRIGKKQKTQNEQVIEPNCRALYLCGSNFPLSRKAVCDAVAGGVPIVSMPDSVYFSDSPDPASVDAWASDVVAAVKRNRKVIVNAKQKPGPNCLRSQDISDAMAAVVRRAVEEDCVDELFVEGGATSAAVMTALQIDCLYPSESIVPGVTRMKVPGYPKLHITMKPGSYSWPRQIWNFNQAT